VGPSLHDTFWSEQRRLARPQVLHTHHENDVLSVILEKPDHHGTFAITLHVRNRFANVERRAYPPDTDRISDSCSEGLHLINLRPGKTADDVGSARDVLPTSSRSCGSGVLGLAENVADLSSSRAALGVIWRLGDDTLAGVQASCQLRPAFNCDPAPPVLDKIPGWQQAIFVTRPSGSSCPVSFELREGSRVKMCYSYTKRRGIPLRQRDNRLLPPGGYAAHGSHASARLGSASLMAAISQHLAPAGAVVLRAE
jgi:hypothetical protein